MGNADSGIRLLQLRNAESRYAGYEARIAERPRRWLRTRLCKRSHQHRPAASVQQRNLFVEGHLLNH